MWSDNDIDDAFQRLNPPEPEPTPFPLDAWLRLENQLDKAVIERAVRRRVWQFFAAEVAVVLLIGLGWLLFRPAATAPAKAATELARQPAASAVAAVPAAGHLARKAARHTAFSSLENASTDNPPIVSPNTASAPAPEASVATRVATTSSSSPASSTASPSTPNAAAAAGALAISRPTKAPPFPVALAPTIPARNQTKRANADAAVHQLGSVSALVAANGTRKAARLSRGRLAVAGRNAATISPDGNVSKTYLETGKRPNSTASRLAGAVPGIGYVVVAEAHQPAHPLSTQTANATSATTAATAGAASSASAPRRIEANNDATDFTPLALRPVPAPEAGAVPLPTPLTTVTLAETPLQPEVPKPAREPRFYVALVGAPDVSTVKFASIEKPMANVGLVLEYRLSSHLRVNTGLLRSTKQYVARRADYNFGAYAANIAHRYFDDVDGSCTVLDMPLNLRYDLLTRPRYRLYGSAGLSSFFMQREEYSYAYTENYRPGYWYGEYVNANRHYLSILNLSAGYERALSSRWSLQAEPYLKLPLAGVGTGKIRLTSAGVFLGIKYGF